MLMDLELHDTATRALRQSRGWEQNSIVLIGDSRLAQSYLAHGSTNIARNAANFVTTGLALCGQRVRIAAQLAVSGSTSAQYLAAGRAAAFATGAKWALICGIVNDIDQSGPEPDYWNLHIKPFVAAWTAQGRQAILMTETGTSAMSSASVRGAVHRYNAQIREFCRSSSNAILFDAAAIVMLPDTAMTLNPAYSSDGVHINKMAGALALGQAFGALMERLAPANGGQVATPDQVFANGAVQWFSNPLWLNASGGSAGGPNVTWSGDVPAGITGSGSTAGATEMAGIVVAGPHGNDLRLDIETAQGGMVQLQLDLTAIGTENQGDRFYGNAEFELAEGASNFQWAGIYLESRRSGVTRQVDDGVPAVGAGALPPGALRWISETDQLQIDAGTREWLTGYLRFYFSDAGSATIAVRRTGLFRVVP
jgi:hypothetical protein